MNKGMKIPGCIASGILLLTFLAVPVQSFSQGRSLRHSNTENKISEGDPEQPKSRKVKKAEAKAADVKEQQERAYSKAKAKDMKHRMDLQTPATQKRMKESKKQADQHNDHYHRSFWGKIFGRKR